MPEIINVNNTDLVVKTWKNQRVVTFKDIDEVHKRPEGTARRTFTQNKKHFIENEDYFFLKPENLENTGMGILYPSETLENTELDEKRPIELKSDNTSETSNSLMNEIRPSEIKDENSSESSNSLKYEIHTSINQNDINTRGTIFLTESGYLMLVKSFNDDKAWEVQRTLVNTYFKAKEVFTITEQQYNALLNNYNTLVDKLNELSTKLIVNTETTNKLDCRVACIESGISVSGGRLSPWVKEMSSKVMELADCYEKTVKKMYSLIIEHMEDKFGLFFNGYYSQYVADHPNEKTIWRIVVIEYYDLNDLFESAYKDLAKEIGLYPDNRVDAYYEF